MLPILQFDADVATITGDLPDAFRFNGTSYTCAAADLHDAHMQSDMGLILTPTISLTVRTALFTSDGTVPDRVAFLALVAAKKIPKTHDDIIYDGRKIHADIVERSVDGVTLTLHLVSPMGKG